MAASSNEAPLLPTSITAWIHTVISLGLCAIAIWRGGKWEQRSGLLLAAIETVGTAFELNFTIIATAYRHLIVDAIELIYFLALALIIGRPWMIFAAAFQVLSTLTHPASQIANEIGRYAYLSIVIFFSYGVFLSVTVGALLHPKSKPNHQHSSIKSRFDFI